MRTFHEIHTISRVDSAPTLTEDELFVLDPTTLKLTQTITIKSNDPHVGSCYWTADNMVVSPDQEHVMVFDKYIDLNTGKPIATLDVASALAKRNPNPKAFDISPSGKLGLVFVHSFSAGKLNALGVFDLKTGKLVHARETGERVKNAVFVSEDQLVVFYADRRITTEDLKGKILDTLTRNGPVVRPSGNIGGNCVAFSGSGKNRAIITSGSTRDDTWQVWGFDATTHKILFRDACEGNLHNACEFTSVTAKANSAWVLYQITRVSKTLCGCGAHPLFEVFLRARNIRSGKVSELKVPEDYSRIGLLVLSPKGNILYCTLDDSVIRFALPSDFMREKQARRNVEQGAPADGDNPRR